MEGGAGDEDARTDPPRPLSGRPFSPRALVDKAVSNVISSLTFGRRFEYDDPRFLKLLDRLQAGVEEDQGFLHEVWGGGAKEPCRVGRSARPEMAPEEGLGRGAWEKRHSKTEGLEVGKCQSREMAGAGPGSAGQGEGLRTAHLLPWRWGLDFSFILLGPGPGKTIKAELREEPCQWWGHSGAERTPWRPRGPE